jgi:transposase
MSDYDLYVGIDWATQSHQVCLVDQAGRRREQRQVAHSGAALSELADALTRLVADPARMAVAIEVPRGAIVDTLLERGGHVFALNPKQLDRFRDRHTVAGAKDDRRDAFVLADALRTDRAAFRRLAIEAPAVIQLREVARIHAELVEETGRLTNRLREQVWRFYPHALRLCPAADEPWFWALLALAPTPAEAARLSRSTLAALLARHRIRRLTADDVLTTLQAPALYVAPGTAEAAREHIALLLPRLALVHDQRTGCERRLAALLAAAAAAEAAEEQPEHRDVTILRSLPGVGRVVAATMLAEAARPLAARDYQTLRAHGGVAPVTRQSGKSRQVVMRRSCNPRLRHALFHWARNSIRLDARCGAQYMRLRRRHGHARALRGVADRLLRVLVAMLTTRTLYRSEPVLLGT